MTPFLQSLVAVVLVGLIPVFIVVIAKVAGKSLTKSTHWLVSFAIGALLGNALLHLIPEIFAETENTTFSSLLIIGGILLFYGLEQFLRWHHHHDPQESRSRHPAAVMSVFGDSAHNFLDGLLIVGSFLVNPSLGWATALAVALHEIPQEIADFSIMFHAKWALRKIFLVSILSGALALLGAITGYILTANLDQFSLYTLSVTAGGFLYIACTDLIPDLHHFGASRLRERVLQLIVIASGISLFLLV